MTSPRYPVLNIDEVEEQNSSDGVYWRGFYKSLTPWMEANGGAVCVNFSRLPPGCVGCPFHYHMVDDEVFYILSGTGVLRYGDQLIPIRPGDTISCPAGSRIAHQIANTGNEDLVYLGIGANSSNEVCCYPDSNKVMVRSLKTVGTLTETDYMNGEPEYPLILDMAKKLSNARE